MIQEFHISVTPIGGDEYLVRTEQVAPGVPLAEEQVVWPVEQWLRLAGRLMDEPIAGVLQGSTEPASPDLVQLGQQLYNALFQGTIRDSWVTAQGVAQHRQAVLRLRLGLGPKDSRVWAVPWEVLYAGNRPLATGMDVVFSRYRAIYAGRPPAQVQQNWAPDSDRPLQILMAIATPADQVGLALKQEALQLQAELQALQENAETSGPEIELTILEQPGREQLTQALEQGRYQVLHYAGHSEFSLSGGHLYLVNGRTGLTETLSGDDLAGLLANNGIRMAVFNSCRGAHSPLAAIDQAMSRNLADVLVQRGVPAVLAMAERIPDEVALTLTRLFYRNLKQRYAIDLSLSRARQGLISAYGSKQLYWALPILYLQPEFDGRLLPAPPDSEGEGLADVANAPWLPWTGILPVEEGDAVIDPGEIDWASDRLEGAELLNGAIAVEDAEPETEQAAEPQADQAPARSPSSSLPWETEAPERPAADNDEIYGPEDYDAEDYNPEDYGDFDEEDLGEFVDDLGEYEDLGGFSGDVESWDQNEADYENDASVVADLFRQITTSEPPAEAPSSAPPEPEPVPVAVAAAPAEPAPALPVVPAPPEKPTPKPSLLASSRSRLAVLIAMGSIVGLGAIAAVGLWVRDVRLSRDLGELPPGIEARTDQASTSSVAPEDLAQAETATVTAIAIESFSQPNLDRGNAAVAALLDRGALAQAKAALATVPNQTLDDPGVSFLRGRLAWQSLQSGDNTFSIDDARRYWETAAKADAENPLYQNALGFAYYLEGNLNRANDVWLATLAVDESAPAGAAGDKAATLSPATLNAYAGLALTLAKAAQNESPDQQANLRSKAAKLYQMVMLEDPVRFQPDALAKDWLWTETMIREWQAIAQLKD